ncbi:MAG TPA: hypothetical protein GX701_00375 [Clostridiales bacterium]|jgi:hypothetical protein|nr:hypothetical protein [Clostridiales bacterium]
MVSVRREIVVKTLYYILLLFIFAGLETAVFPRFFNLRHTPLLLPFLCAAVAVYDGEVPGLLAGFFAGFFMDGFTGVFPYYTIMLLVAGGVIGAGSPHYFRKRIPPAMLWGAGTILVVEMLRFFIFIYLPGVAGLSEAFTVVLPRAFFSLLFSPLWVGPIFWIRRFFRREQRFYR